MCIGQHPIGQQNTVNFRFNPLRLWARLSANENIIPVLRPRPHEDDCKRKR